jgi:hypothetical protein
MFRRCDHRSFSTISFQHGLVGVHLSPRRVYRMHYYARERDTVGLFPRFGNHFLGCGNDSLDHRLARHLVAFVEGIYVGRTVLKGRRGEGSEGSRDNCFRA